MARVAAERHCRILRPKIALCGLLIFCSGFRLVSSYDARAAEPTRLRISIPGLGTTSYPLIMAQKKGYFRAEGYDVELIPMTGGLAVKTLMVGEVNLILPVPSWPACKAQSYAWSWGFCASCLTTWWPRRR